MAKLYSYCLRHDDGAAPNPFWGICTLVICKPAIRRSAQVGDWIVGLGSANSPIGAISDCIVYAMEVTSKMTLREYDAFCRTSCPNKIPQWRNLHDTRLRFGDCIYDYSHGEPPKQRWGVHTEDNMKRDLSGGYALISEHYYYFGDKPIRLPSRFHPIIHGTQGHKSTSNQPYFADFVSWIAGLGFELNRLYGQPQMWSLDRPHEQDDEALRRACSSRHLESDEEDQFTS